ncbi:MAG: energy-coupling factor transporter transmembrane protein EcfT [Sporolactobacillus sp.]
MQIGILRTRTWFFKINPTLKFLVIAALFIVYLTVHNLNTMIWSALIFLGFYLLVSGFGRLFNFWLIILTLVVSLFSGAAMIFFGKGSHLLFQFGLVQISTESLARGLMLGIRTFAFSLLSLIFATTTEPVPFFYSLMQQLKVPVRYAYGCLAAFRMLPLMAEEFLTIRQAMRVRGLAQQKGAKAFYERIKRYCLMMLVQSIRRAQRTAVAMRAKRFSLSGSRTYFYKIGWSRYDLLFAVSMVLAVAAGFILAQVAPLTPFNNVLDQY